jgi:hypothetical protein
MRQSTKNIWSRWGLFLGYLELVIAIPVLAVYVDAGLQPDKAGPVGQSLRVAAQAEQLYRDDYGTYATSLGEDGPIRFHPAYGVTITVLRADADSYCLRGSAGKVVLYLASSAADVSHTSCV